MLTQRLGLYEDVVTVKVLVGGLWELRQIGLCHGLWDGYSIHHHLAVKLICFHSAVSQGIANKILWLSLSVRESALLIIVTLCLVLFSQDLRLGAELKAVVLREVLYNPLLFVEIS